MNRCGIGSWICTLRLRCSASQSLRYVPSLRAYESSWFCGFASCLGMLVICVYASSWFRTLGLRCSAYESLWNRFLDLYFKTQMLGFPIPALRAFASCLRILVVLCLRFVLTNPRDLWFRFVLRNARDLCL